MKKKSIVIPINSYAELDKPELIRVIENRLPCGTYVKSIKGFIINRDFISYNDIHKKKNIDIKHLIVSMGQVEVSFTYIEY